jgi:flagellar hook-basal body complex protein FliE
MNISSIGTSFVKQAIPTPEAAPAQGSFGDTIKKAVGEVNDLQQKADGLATRLAAGDAVEVHQAMIAMQKASTAMQFTIQVRNKVVEAYQEVMRMQV